MDLVASRFLSFVAIVLIAAGAQAANRETRCDAIDAMTGGHCDCSEPYNTNTPSTSGLTNATWDPGDTEGSGAKECGAMEGVYGVEVYPVAATAYQPAGAALDYVLEIDNPTNVVRGCNTNGGDYTTCIKGRPRDDLIKGASTRHRVCYRAYYNFDSNWTGGGASGGACKNKFLSGAADDGGGKSLLAIQDNVASNNNKGILRIARTSFNGISDGEYPNYDNYTQAQRDVMPSSSYCQGNIWCGMEWCVTGNLAAGTNIKAEVYFWTSDGARSFTKTDLLGTAGVTTQPSPTDWDSYMPNLYRQKDPGACLGKRRISHFMQASWDTDSGQRIGPAAEMQPPAAPDATVQCE